MSYPNKKRAGAGWLLKVIHIDVVTYCRRLDSNIVVHTYINIYNPIGTYIYMYIYICTSMLNVMIGRGRRWYFCNIYIFSIFSGDVNHFNSPQEHLWVSDFWSPPHFWLTARPKVLWSLWFFFAAWQLLIDVFACILLYWLLDNLWWAYSLAFFWTSRKIIFVRKA